MADNIFDRIKREAAELSKGERNVARAILDDPLLSAGENIAELANRAGVSQPTVCRFCTRFGASGFREFKTVLNAAIRKEAEPAQNKAIKVGDTVNDVIHKVFTSLQTTLQDTERNLDPDVIARSIDLVSQAGRIIIAAHGMSKSSASDFAVRLLNLGMHAEIYDDNIELLMAIASARVGDLMIIISSTGEDKDYIEAARIAQINGVTTLSICPANTSLQEQSSLFIKGGYKCDDTIASMTGQMAATVVLQSVIAGVTLRRADLNKAVRKKIEQAILSTQLTKDINNEALEEQKTASDQQVQSLKADSPITVLNWKH